MKTSTYITVEEDLLYKSIAQQYNMSYSSSIPPVPSFQSVKELEKRIGSSRYPTVEEERQYKKLAIHPLTNR